MTATRLAERLAQLLPVLFGVSLIVFLMITLTPGDPVEIMMGDQRVTPEQIEALRRDLGLDRPLVERFLVFLGNAVRGDFGISFFHRRPVWDVIAERLPATIELTLTALIVAILVAIPLGVIAAVKRDSWIDRALSAASLFGVSLPGFWFGILLILLFSVEFRLLPVGGRIAFAFEVPRETHRKLLEKFMVAARSGKREAIRALLAENAVAIGDGGGKVASVLTGMHGADRVTNLYWANHLNLGERLVYRMATINGEPGLLRYVDGQLESAQAMVTDGQRIVSIYVVRNPDKLANIGRGVTGAARAASCIE